MKTKNILIGLISSLTMIGSAIAIEANNSLELTQVSNNGNEVVVDLHVINPSNQQIASVQSWLEFDEDKLKGKTIDTEDSPFDFVIPGESNFDGNLIKIGRSTLGGDTAGDKIFVAQITFEVLEEGGEVRFYDYQDDDSGHVSVQILDGGFPVNTLAREPEPLSINKGGTGIGQGDPGEPVQSSIPERPSNVLITTGVGNITIKWDKVEGGESYYVYYGNISGRYLQRRQVGDVDIYKLDGLDNDTQYFFAVTTVGEGNLESDYSDEVAVIIGNPKTSTSPLMQDNTVNTQKPAVGTPVQNPPSNGGSIPTPIQQPVTHPITSETGPALTFLIALSLSVTIALIFGRRILTQ